MISSQYWGNIIDIRNLTFCKRAFISFQIYTMVTEALIDKAWLILILVIILGKVGSWKALLSDSQSEALDAQIKEKLAGTGLAFEM